jgi:hypothetical protein
MWTEDPMIFKMDCKVPDIHTFRRQFSRWVMVKIDWWNVIRPCFLTCGNYLRTCTPAIHCSKRRVNSHIPPLIKPQIKATECDNIYHNEISTYHTYSVKFLNL